MLATVDIDRGASDKTSFIIHQEEDTSRDVFCFTADFQIVLELDQRLDSRANQWVIVHDQQARCLFRSFHKHFLFPLQSFP